MAEGGDALKIDIETRTRTGDDLLEACRALLGKECVLTGTSMDRYLEDWTGRFSVASQNRPHAVLRPGSTTEVAEAVRLCAAHDVAVVPQGGRTGLCGGALPVPGHPCVILTLDRMAAIRQIDTDARTLTVEAGTILETAQDVARDSGLVFPLTFGAQGSCMIGGALATNAGGSNVVRYGNTRDLCLGIEAVLADGSIVSNLDGLHKDNTGYDLRHLLIGSEGTLGIITAAVFRLAPEPCVRAAGFFAMARLDDAAEVLNQLQDCTGGAVEAFEFMSDRAVEVICRAFPDIRPPLDSPTPVGVFFELASSRPSDALPDSDGSPVLHSAVLTALGTLMDDGIVTDAMIAQSEQQRLDLWRLRESVLEAMMHHGPIYPADVSLPVSRIAAFLRCVDPVVQQMGFTPVTVGHLGDGNLHYALTAAPGKDWTALPLDAARTVILDALAELGGSFSAEHGIGQDKLDAMRRHKQPAQLAALRAIKAALDPAGILNPGKLLPSPPA